MEWKTVKLGEVLNFRRGHDLPHDKMLGGQIPVAGSNGIIGYHNVATPIEPILTIGRSGNIGTPYFYKSAWAHNTTLYVDDFKGNDPLFLYYLCQTLPFASFKGGSAVPTLNRNHIHPLEIKYPVHKEDQQKISAILSSLDAQIENNNRINRNLEAQAQALFKSWFVDFEPWGGTMPDDWKEGCLGEILSLQKQSIKAENRGNLPYLPIDMIPMHSFAVTKYAPTNEANSSLVIFEKDDILIGAMRVYFHRVIPAPTKGITRSTCFVLRPKNSEYFSYALLTCNQNEAIDYANAGSKGSTMPYAVWEGAFEKYPITIPNNMTMAKFNNLIMPLIKKIQQNSTTNTNLAQLRDTLLPKLMSGEIEV